ncbi:uncharacterized protein TNCV_2266601 [Trichonephila clavipes]|nr:uncharacterized protein TNCV_2266601 [Trichonephila clavipes]
MGLKNTRFLFNSTRILVQNPSSGRGSLVVKVMDSWPACHEFEPSATKDPPCREAMHVKSVGSSNVLPLSWGGNYETGCQLRGRPRHLTMVQNYEVRRQKPSSS